MDQKSSEKKSENSPKSVNPNDISHNHSNKIPLNNYAQPLPNYAFTPGYPYPSYYPSAPWNNIRPGFIPHQNVISNYPMATSPIVPLIIPAAVNSKVSNAPWHKPHGSSSTVRPSYASAAEPPKVNVKITKGPVLTPNFVKNTSAIPILTTSVPLSSNSNNPSVAPKEEWSSNVKAFVERAFLSCQTPAQRDIMEQLLRLKIKEAISTERMTKINWELEPIPLISSEFKEKQKNLKTFSTKLSKNNSKTNLSEQTNIINSKLILSIDEKKSFDRAKRFESDQQAFKKQQELNQLALQNVRIEDNQGDVIDWDEYTIVGTCQKLEKPYLRLTSAPDPATVRPLPVLKATLKLLKDKWRSNADYGYICDQFKSLRQDMTVQRIKSDFTVLVYEIHARIAIEQGDLGQYNQCQTQLKDLYDVGLSGSESEFMAYRLLYLIHCRNKQAINQFLGELSVDQRENEAISHALKVCSAVALGNYSQLFNLYKNAPNMGAYFMDLFVARERLTSLNIILKAYRPTISIPFLTDILAFASVEDCKTWLVSEIGEQLVSSNPNFIDCKTALLNISSK